MLKRLALWKYGIAVVIILGCCVYVTRQDQKTRDEYEEKCSQLNASTLPPSGHHENCDEGAENAARHLPRWFGIFRWPEGITTWAILLTLFVIADQTAQIRKSAEAALTSADAARTQIKVMETQAGHMESQIREMQTQTAVAKTSAENALLNTKALINAERPWIVINVESPTPNQFNFIIENVGRTPAHVKSIWASWIPTRRGERLEIPSDDETEEPIMGFSSYLLPPTASQIAFRFNIEEMNQRGGFFPTHELRFYGRILYSDILQSEGSPLHETKWLYWQIPVEGALPFADPAHPEHNGYT